MTVWHTSDLHIGHRRVAEDRWYRSHSGYYTMTPALPEDYVGWHDEMLAQNWDKTVQPGDKVYVQGDLTLQGKNAIEKGLAWIAERRAATRPENIIFIPGNHDGCHTGIERSTSFKWFKRYMEYFDMVTPYARIRINGEVVHLSHFPYQGGGDHTATERYTQYRLPYLGDWLLHGHTHSTERYWAGDLITYPGAKHQIHIGVDSNDYTPVSHEEIAIIMEAHREPPGQAVLSGEP
jgi:calcineurin-like phosphoesterase family protein